MDSRPPLGRRARALALVFSAAAVCAGAGPVAAARADGASPAPADAGAPDAGTAPVELDELVIRVPGAEATRDPTGAVTVVEAGRYAGEAKAVAELVATAPGVAVSAYGGLGQLSTVSIRGSSASGVLVLLDGLPLNTAFGGGVDLSTLPRQWIERIEVLRGAEGAHYGAGALGGVVNVVTRGGEPGRWSAEASGGEFGTAAASAEAAAGGERWTLFGAAGAERSDGDFTYRKRPQSSLPGSPYQTFTRENNGSARAGGIAKLTARLGERRLDALLQLSGGRRELAGWPGNDTPDDWQRDARALASVRLSGPGPAPGLTLGARLTGRADLLDTRIGSLSGGDPVHQRGGAAGAEAEAVLLHPHGALRAALGADGEALRADGLGDTRTRAQLSATLSEDARLAAGRVRLSPAVRAERVGPFAGLSAKLGGSVRVLGPLSARASAGRTFRAPGFAELYLQQGGALPNPSLRPETGLSADAALVAEGARGMASVGGHVTRYEDLIVYQATALGRMKPFNTGRAQVAGLELEAATAPAPRLLGLSLGAAYTYLRTETLRGEAAEVGRDLPFRPRHRLFARAAVAPGPAEAHLEAHYVGPQWRDARNADRVSEALLWNAGASVRLARRAGLRLGLEARNLLDDRTLTDPIGNPLPGRMVMVTLRAGSTPGDPTP
ncbi:TonB-dependent siderophore receptor [Anaeromyxobacter sp. PSR-1]|uniref:TonB-dependent receptor plug domain-containing protein n=1 Tax=unclassified Anaeromyxobacter TaxID=2620896 RepID=UPI0005DE88EF|nr:TonB-dependent receptor [Anaeromyxobacter sp. PSR-1]GAO03937.1 vitamin B12 transporter BtuB [Anaeromyxobacter sp. PSR-1]